MNNDVKSHERHINEDKNHDEKTFLNIKVVDCLRKTALLQL